MPCAAVSCPRAQLGTPLQMVWYCGIVTFVPPACNHRGWDSRDPTQCKLRADVLVTFLSALIRLYSPRSYSVVGKEKSV